MDDPPAPDETSDGGESVDLTEVQAAILEFETSWWKNARAKKTAVRDQFGWSMTRYYQVLDALIDTP